MTAPTAAYTTHPSAPRSVDEYLAWRELVADSRLGARSGQMFTDTISAHDYPGRPEIYSALEAWDASAAKLRTGQAPALMHGEPEPRTHVPAFCRTPEGRPRGIADLREDNAVGTAARWVADWHSPTQPTRGLILVGPPGTGKTSIAAAIAVDCGEPYKASFWEVRDWLSAIKNELNDNVSHTRERAVVKPLLVLDDLGRERRTDFNTDEVRSLLERRYARLSPIVATTNLPWLCDASQPADRQQHRGVCLHCHLGARVWSRLAEMTDVVVVNGPDRRLVEAAEAPR